MIRLLERPTILPDDLSQRGAGDGFDSRGRVVRVTGLLIEADGPAAAVGDVCRIESKWMERPTLAEVVAVRDENLLLMALGPAHGIFPGSEVISTGEALPVPVATHLKGRVIDGFGNPLDGGAPLPLDDSGFNDSRFAIPTNPLKSQRVRQTFRTGIKAIDTFAPCGRGQRVGIFGGSGVGKSTLLGMIARQSEADVNVIALIGPREREVRDFLEKDLGPDGHNKSVVIVASSSQSPLQRVKGAFLAASIAEHFRDMGGNVLLLIDSVTRLAMARRDIGLAIGEPVPTSRDYPPSVFSLLPQLLERSSSTEDGSITGFFSVLAESGDRNEPIADCVRSVADGEIVLSRQLAQQNHFPAIDVLASLSRLNRDLLDPQQLALSARARQALATYPGHEEAILLGNLPPGSHPAIEQAIRRHIGLQSFLRQDGEFGHSLAETWASLAKALASPQKSKIQNPPPYTLQQSKANDNL
jgi:flagellum-specific ATP synthase